MGGDASRPALVTLPDELFSGAVERLPPRDDATR